MCRVAAVISLWGGCAGLGVEDEKMTAPQGNAHDGALQAGYLELAQAEYDEGDYRDSDTFAERSIRAAGGGDVQPEAISARDLPDNMVGTLTSSRERLMAVQIGRASCRERVCQSV